MLNDDGSVDRSEFYVEGRKCPLIEIRKRKLSELERFMRLNVEKDVASRSEEECLLNQVAKNIKRSVGVLFKICRNVNTEILVNLYYALIYPYLIYGLILWDVKVLWKLLSQHNITCTLSEQIDQWQINKHRGARKSFQKVVLNYITDLLGLSTHPGHSNLPREESKLCNLIDF